MLRFFIGKGKGDDKSQRGSTMDTWTCKFSQVSNLLVRWNFSLFRFPVVRSIRAESLRKGRSAAIIGRERKRSSLAIESIARPLDPFPLGE